MRSPLRIQLREDVVEQEERRAAVERRQQVELGELEGEDRGPLLARAMRTPARSRSPSSNDEVVAVRPDERRAVPDLLVGGLGQAAGEGVARRASPGRGGRVGLVAEPEHGARPPRPGRSPRGRPPAAPPRSRSSRRRASSTTLAAGVEKRLVPEAELGRGRRSPRGSRAAGRCAAGAPAVGRQVAEP